MKKTNSLESKTWIRTCGFGTAGQMLVVCCVIAAQAAFTPRAHAVAGVMDAVVLVEDMTDLWKWPREYSQWQQVIRNTGAQVDRSDMLINRADTMIDQQKEIIELLGATRNAVSNIVPDVSGTLKPVEDASTLETERHAQQSSRNLFQLGSNSVRFHNQENKVGETYQAFGRSFQRDKTRYSHFAEQEAMYARYRTAALNGDAVAKSELKVQREAMQNLRRARTDAEVAVFTAAITASQQRQDMAHQKAVQAKSDLEAFQTQLAFEEKRKEEADREWSQQVVSRLRDKALECYQAQLGGAEPGRNPDVARE